MLAQVSWLVQRQESRWSPPRTFCHRRVRRLVNFNSNGRIYPGGENCGVSMRKSAEGKEQNDKRRRDEDCIFLRSSQGCVSATPGRSPQSTPSALRLARIPFNNDVQPSIRSIPILLCTAQTIHPNPRSRWVWKDGVIRTRQGD